jgi:hypothetical protein
MIPIYRIDTGKYLQVSCSPAEVPFERGLLI